MPLSQEIIDLLSDESLTEVFFGDECGVFGDGPESLQNIAELVVLLNNSNKISVNFSNCNIGPQGFGLLTQLTRINKISINNFNRPPAGQNLIKISDLEALVGKNLSALFIKGCAIDNARAEVLATSKTIKTLGLPLNNIDIEGVAALAKNKVIENLNLSDNYLNNVAAEILIQNQTLRKLNISRNVLANGCLGHFLYNNSITTLDISQNNLITDDGLQIFLQNNTITDIALNGCNASLIFQFQLLEKIQENASQALRLAAALRELVRGNKKISIDMIRDCLPRVAAIIPLLAPEVERCFRDQVFEMIRRSAVNNFVNPAVFYNIEICDMIYGDHRITPKFVLENAGLLDVALHQSFRDEQVGKFLNNLIKRDEVIARSEGAITRDISWQSYSAATLVSVFIEYLSPTLKYDAAPYPLSIKERLNSLHKIITTKDGDSCLQNHPQHDEIITNLATYYRLLPVVSQEIEAFHSSSQGLEGVVVAEAASAAISQLSVVPGSAASGAQFFALKNESLESQRN